MLREAYIRARDAARRIISAAPGLPDLYLPAACPCCDATWEQSMRFALDRVAEHETAALYIECPCCGVILSADVSLTLSRANVRKLKG